MSERRWKVGLLGAGYICNAHARALRQRSDVAIVGVCDFAKEKALAASVAFGIPNVFTSLDELLDADVDTVHVLLPPDQHLTAAERVLASGRHVFLEKPMGLSATGCQELVTLAASKGLRIGVDHNFLFLPAYEQLRRRLADRTLGKLDQITINWLYSLELLQAGPFNSWITRDPQNLFFEIGPHLVAFAMDLVGTLDHLQSSASLPIDLPGGGRVYRHWQVQGVRGPTAVTLNLSVARGPSDRSVILRSHGAVARCHFDRDLFYQEEPLGHGFADNFLTALSSARQLGANAVGNLFKSLLGTIRRASTSDPFAESVARSIARFYETIDGQPDPRLEGQFGVNVIRECERIVDGAKLARKETTGTWRSKPPLQRPSVLVLGGTGFIGQYLVRALVARGVGVRVLTRSLGSAQIALADLPVQIMQGDLADASFIDAALENIDVVYDLAKVTASKWEDYYRQDVLVTQEIAARALAKGVKRFIYAGSIASYYSGSARDVITSDTPLDRKMARRDHYSRSKAACEALLMDLNRTRNFPVVIFRPGIVIGKGSPPSHWGVGMYLSDTRVQLWGDGRNLLPFVLVTDVADALVLALDKPGIEGQTFLLTDEPLLSARDYVEAMSDACGTTVRMEPKSVWSFFVRDVAKEIVKHLISHPNRRIPSYRDYECRTNRARYDSSKTKEVLGWRPAGTREALIEKGIREAVRDVMR